VHFYIIHILVISNPGLNIGQYLIRTIVTEATGRDGVGYISGMFRIGDVVKLAGIK
jgi:hypothetical protein